MTLKTTITREDILSLEDFVKVRKDKRAEVVATKKNRRVGVGPFCTFYFENYTTMWWQIHEMLFIEKGGEEQIADELAAYEPLVPKGSELVATFMIEVDDAVRRPAVLAQLTNIDQKIVLEFGSHRIRAVPEDDAERNREDGKTSSVHFLRFPFTAEQITAFRTPGTRVLLGIEHENYGHIAVMPEAVRENLSGDFA
ncbi:MAG TPA: DUF3501 family protein [Ferrovibrio sp.]|uniref:DUF3501 family protein n=1 Tax=Ferrovibrio sp. TaxID=1917215 RepID=UPI002B4B66A0|nr:DUF3501 family protein [Ferrovibrio sp.]HLT77984.1 DUF3501 family protein [Ferrovibrio sp.]